MRLLHNTRKHGLTVDEYLLKIKNLARKLIVAGDEVTEKDLVMYILGGLGYDFKPIATILEVKHDQYSFKDVQHHFLSYESKLDEENSAVNFDITHKAAHSLL